MSRGINIGDKVTVHWSEGDGMDGTVESIPSDVGDLWYIRDVNGILHAINSAASNFEQIILRQAAVQEDVAWNAALEAAEQVLARYLHDGTTKQEDARVRHMQQAIRGLRTGDVP